MKYQNSKIYKLVSPSGLTYIGSTTQSLAKRKGKHKTNYKCWKGGYQSYCTSFKLLDEAIDDIDIVLLETCNVNNKEELHAKERYWIESTDCVNKVVPGRTQKEANKVCREKNKEKYAEKRKEYFQKNKERKRQYVQDNRDRINEVRREHYEANKEEIRKKEKEHRNKNKEKYREYSRQFREKNKDAINEKAKKYRDEHKEQKKAYLRTPVFCECGGKTTIGNKSNHAKTKQHRKWLQVDEDEN